MKPKNHLTSTATDALLRRTMSPAELARGRFMRAPDGHEGEGEGGDAGAAAEAGTEDSGEDQGDADQPEGTVLGGAGKEQAGEKEGGEAGEGEGKGAAAAGAAGPPDKYELTTPDGFDAIDNDVLVEAEPVFRELGLTNEQADKLTPIAAGLVKKTMDRAEKAITDRAIAQRKEWADAFDKDEEIGGANKDETVRLAAKAFDHYGLKPDAGVRQVLNESGLGNHPDLIRFVSRIGRDLEEGSFERGDPNPTPKAPEQKLYGAEFQPKG